MEENLNSNMEMPYMKEYNEFISSYKTKEISGEEIGEKITRMAQYYAIHNIRLLDANKKLSLVAMEKEAIVDESTLKQISSAKAKILTDATTEAHEYAEQKTHVQNIEQFINALKSLQKGVLNEYSHMG